MRFVDCWFDFKIPEEIIKQTGTNAAYKQLELEDQTDKLESAITIINDIELSFL